METWYLLLSGSSADGIGTPDYIGRTKDMEIAKAHVKKERSSPFSTGGVQIINDNSTGFYFDWPSDAHLKRFSDI